MAKLSGIDRELAELDTTLWQLKPQLAADREQAQRQVADLEGELNRHQREFQAEEQAYGERRDALNDQHSEVASQLQHAQHRLNDLQTRFEQYADADMPGLEQDINALPQWREQRDQLQQHLQVMQDAVKESQARLDGRLRELSENLARQTQENQELIDALVEEKAERREQQWQTEQQHNERYQQARQRLESEYQAQLELGVEQLAELKAQLAMPSQTREEAQEAELAQARLDDAQQARSAAGATSEALRRELEAHKRERDTAEQHLVQCRQQRERAEQHCYTLYQQQTPEQGSLRHFLRYHRPGWEQQLGKVIAPELLERRDLAPQLADHASDDLFGLALDLSAIALPDYAQDEASLLAAIEEAESAKARAHTACTAAEKALKQHNERVQQADDAQDTARPAHQRAEQEVEYALEARRQQQARHAESQKARRAHIEAARPAEQAQTELRDEKRDALGRAGRNPPRPTAGTQGRRPEPARQPRCPATHLQTAAQRCQRRTPAPARRAGRGLQPELAEQGVDPAQLKATRTRLEAQNERIRKTAARQEELAEYQRFMRIEWGQHKPQLVAEEAELARRDQQLKRDKAHLKNAFHAAREAHQQAVNGLKAQRDSARGTLEALTPLLNQLESLELVAEGAPLEASPGDVDERIERTRQARPAATSSWSNCAEAALDVESQLIKDASSGFADALQSERDKLPSDSPGYCCRCCAACSSCWKTNSSS